MMQAKERHSHLDMNMVARNLYIWLCVNGPMAVTGIARLYNDVY